MSYYDSDKNKIRRRKVSSHNSNSKTQVVKKNNINRAENTITCNDKKIYTNSTGNRVEKANAKKIMRKNKLFGFIKKILVFGLIIGFIGAISLNILMNVVLKDSPVITYSYLKEKSISSEYVSIANIPINLQNAIVSIEDERFYENKGVDYMALFRSVVHNIFHKSTQGGSTIEMQLSKNLLTTSDQTISRKLKDMKNAKEINKHLNKREILEIYLNNIYLGKSTYGVAKGAKIYFNKDIKELNLGECALLAGITNNPGLYSKDYEAAKKRRDVILYKMQELGYITKDDYEITKRQETPMNLK